MSTDTGRITIHMVCSLDGFIAKKDNSISWMHSTDNYPEGIVLTEEKIAEFLGSIDCYLMGSRTYEHALQLGWPYGEVPVYVLSNRKLNDKRESVKFYTGDLQKFVNDTLRPSYKNIWMVGGAKLTKELIRLQLADEIVIAILPILLGDGILFFDYIGEEHPLHLKDVTAFKDGMVELQYELKKNSE